jgi:hypothetical protein
VSEIQEHTQRLEPFDSQLRDQSSLQERRFTQTGLPVKHRQGIFPDPEKEVAHLGSAPEKVSVVFLCKWVKAQPGVVRINGRTT